MLGQRVTCPTKRTQNDSSDEYLLPCLAVPFSDCNHTHFSVRSV